MSEEEGAERRRQMAASGQREMHQTEASAAYLLTDESCGARIRGRHVSAAGALFLPIAPTQVGEKEEGGGMGNRGSTSSPQPPDHRRERKGGAQPKCFTADDAALPQQPFPIQN